MSLTLSMNWGSGESLKLSLRCGCRPKARQMPETAVWFMPTAWAIDRVNQWVASLGVRVNAVCPGWVRTPMADGNLQPLVEREGISLDEAYAITTRDVPLRRPATPDEIARSSVSWLPARLPSSPEPC
jgi:NAD(P)-dependent dehydrogenase (short-subunit alcohol dehydrogenase family)